MENNEKVELAIKNILHEQKNLTTHVKNLDESERRRVLMYIANFCASAGYHTTMMESIELLGFRDEEVLIFCTASIGGGRPQLVPDMVERFCKNTAIARGELSSCARGMIRWAKNDNSTRRLLDTVECVKLMRENIKLADKGDIFNNESTNLVLFILHTNEEVRDRSDSTLVLESLRKLVPDDNVWELLRENKQQYFC